jgi:nucleoside-diphosphate-sugar epimerase
MTDRPRPDSDSDLHQRPVLVTGATGYVAGWIVERLLRRGCTVHAAVRDPDDETKRAALDALARERGGTIRWFRADLLDEGSYAEAMAGCGVVMHTASPFTLRVDDPERDLVAPARLGTRNVLEQAERTDSVRRVVVTSSCAAIYGDNADLARVPGDAFTENDWNQTSSLHHQPYSYSKTLAEREAWAIAGRQNRFDVVTINPSLVLGPGIRPFPGSESFQVLARLADGTMRPGVPDFGIGIVDVRDVADAHVAAAFRQAAKGRYIVSGHDSDFPELAKILRQRYGDRFPFPRRVLPKWVAWLFGPIADRSISRRVIARNVGLPFRADNTKSRKELGIAYRPLEDSVLGMFEQIVEHGLVRPRGERARGRAAG